MRLSGRQSHISKPMMDINLEQKQLKLIGKETRQSHFSRPMMDEHCPNYGSAEPPPLRSGHLYIKDAQ